MTTSFDRTHVQATSPMYAGGSAESERRSSDFGGSYLILLSERPPIHINHSLPTQLYETSKRIKSADIAPC
jgi:hypothetical protein